MILAIFSTVIDNTITLHLLHAYGISFPECKCTYTCSVLNGILQTSQYGALPVAAGCGAVLANDENDIWSPHNCTTRNQCDSCINYITMVTAHKNKTILERCNPSPHVANRHISISQLLSLWCHSSGTRSPHSHYDVILNVTSFATELATPTVRTYIRYGHLTAFNIKWCIVLTAKPLRTYTRPDKSYSLYCKSSTVGTIPFSSQSVQAVSISTLFTYVWKALKTDVCNIQTEGVWPTMLVLWYRE